MVEPWQYFLVVPSSAVVAADAASPSLGNPSGIRDTFVNYPPDVAQGEGAWWLASFVAFDLVAEGTPSRQALEGSLSQYTALAALLWVRTKNPHHPNTPETDRNKVVASNWPAFPPGATIDWAAVTAALTA